MRTAIAVLFFGLLVPTAAHAQACLGVPQGQRGALLGTLDFPEDATTYGASGIARAGEVLLLGASFHLTSYDVDGFDVENEKTVGAQIAGEIPSLRETASVCPSVGISYSWVEGASLTSIPVGIGVGTTVPLGETGAATLTPFVMPTFIYAKIDVDNFVSDDDTFFGLAGGATVGFGRFLVGARIGKIFEEGTDVEFGIHGGFGF